MKKNIFIILLVINSLNLFSQEKKEDAKSQIVEASCGQCNFGLKGKSCDLAVKINGKAYFVDGTNIDDHGDAHSKDGFCMAVKKAEVKGEIVADRFKASYFKVIEERKKEK